MDFQFIQQRLLASKPGAGSFKRRPFPRFFKSLSITDVMDAIEGRNDFLVMGVSIFHCCFPV